MAARSLQPQRGTMPVLQFCTPAQLQVDTTYQRPTDARLSRALIDRIARAWDWRLYQPLVVARRADGNLYVVDGQHRLEAARVRGDIPQLPCVVASYDSAQEEATAFVAINQQRKPLSALNIHRAALAAGDGDAILLDQLIVRAGLRMTAACDTKTWKPGWINNIVMVATCLRQHGERVTRLSLEALAAGFDGQVLRYCGTLFGAIFPVVAVAEVGGGFVPFILTEILREGGAPDAWMARVRAAASERGLGIGPAARALLAEAYAEATAE